MGWFSIFSRKTEPENFENVLEELRLSIQSRQTRLAEIRLRERRASLWVTLYLFAAWAVYAGVWYVGWVGRLLGTDSGEYGHGAQKMWRKGLAGSLVLVGPLLALSARRIVQLWYTRIGNAEEETLKKLLLEQRAKVEQLKKKTDFYSTQKLLERYDRPDNAPMATPVKKGPMPAGPRSSLNPNGLGPNQNQPLPGIGLSTPVRPGGPPMNGASPTPMHPGYMSAYSPAQPIQPTPRRWFDRLADVVLGEEEGGGAGAHSKYALICKRCFTHNGLVKEVDYDSTQFVCMKCGFLNPAPKSTQRQHHPATSRDVSPINDSHSTHAPQLSSPVSPSPSNLAASMAAAPSAGATSKAPKGGLALAPVALAGEDTEEEDTPSKRPGQKVTQRRQTRNSRKSTKNAEGYEMELDE